MANVVIASYNEKLINTVLRGLFGTEANFSGQNGVETDVLLTSKYYTHQLHLFLDKIDEQELPQWLDELSSDEMAELRDSVQGIVVIADDLSKIENATLQLTQLSSVLDRDFVSKDIYEWDGLKVVVLLQSAEDDEISDEVFETIAKTGFSLVPVIQLPNDNKVSPFDELSGIFQTTAWRNIKLNESQITPLPTGLKDSKKEVSLDTIMDQIHAAKKEANRDPKRALELANQIAEHFSYSA